MSTLVLKWGGVRDGINRSSREHFHDRVVPSAYPLRHPGAHRLQRVAAGFPAALDAGVGRVLPQLLRVGDPCCVNGAPRRIAADRDWRAPRAAGTRRVRVRERIARKALNLPTGTCGPFGQVTRPYVSRRSPKVAVSFAGTAAMDPG